MAIERMWWALDDSPVPAEIAGFLWWQGEADALNSTTSAAWCQSFTRLVSDVRVDLQTLGLPVAFVRLNNEVPTGQTYWSTVRQQQDWVTMRSVSRVNIDDLPSLSDKTHYPTASYLQIGERMADAMAQMTQGA